MPMKHLSIMKLFLLSALLSLLGSCTDVLQSEQSSASKADEDIIGEMRRYFESTSPALRQVRFGKHDHAESRSSLPATANLSPNWKASRIWDAYKETYMEIPLQGEGIYHSSVIRSKRSIHAFPTKSALIITRNHQTEEIRYYVVTVIVNPCGEKNIPEESFHFVGNSDFNGILIFSKVDGSFIQALRVRNHHSYPIGIGLPPTGATRSASDPASTSSEYYTLMLTSSTMGYTCGECSDGCTGSGPYTCATCGCPVPEPSTTCGCCKDAESSIIYCPFCHDVCDPYTNACPNGCEVGITPEDHYVICGVCGAYYNTNLFKHCPNGCNDVMVCPICHKYPCECRKVCERCGSMACPGPWFCSANDDECTGEQCLVCGGYKSATRSSSNCPVCTCDNIPLYSIVVGVVPNRIELGGNYTVSVSNTSANLATIISLEYKAIDYRDKNTDPISLGSSSTMSKTFRAYRSGVWGIQATAIFSDGYKATSEVQNITIENPSYSTIMNNPVVIQKMDSLWNATMQAANAKIPSYREKGCWIIFNTINNTYEFSYVDDSPELVCEVGTDIVFPYPDVIPGGPDRGGQQAVGTFHTHPARTKCDPTLSYGVGPSEVDKAMNTVCLVYDYVTKVDGGHNPGKTHKLYHYGTVKCGKERHPLNY